MLSNVWEMPPGSPMIFTDLIAITTAASSTPTPKAHAPARRTAEGAPSDAAAEVDGPDAAVAPLLRETVSHRAAHSTAASTSVNSTAGIHDHVSPMNGATSAARAIAVTENGAERPHIHTPRSPT